jgi:hypothetical protein
MDHGCNLAPNSMFVGCEEFDISTFVSATLAPTENTLFFPKDHVEACALKGTMNIRNLVTR